MPVCSEYYPRTIRPVNCLTWLIPRYNAMSCNLRKITAVAGTSIPHLHSPCPVSRPVFCGIVLAPLIPNRNANPSGSTIFPDTSSRDVTPGVCPQIPLACPTGNLCAAFIFWSWLFRQACLSLLGPDSFDPTSPNRDFPHLIVALKLSSPLWGCTVPSLLFSHLVPSLGTDSISRNETEVIG